MAPLSLDHAKNYRNERILDDTRDVTDGRIDREVLTIYTPDNVVTHTRVLLKHFTATLATASLLLCNDL